MDLAYVISGLVAFAAAWVTIYIARKLQSLSSADPSFYIPVPKVHTLSDVSERECEADTQVCLNPSTGEPLGIVKWTSEHQLRRLLLSARKNQPILAEASFGQRRTFLRILRSYIVKHVDDVSETLALDSGKLRFEAVLGDILPVCAKINWLCDHGEKYLQRELRNELSIITAHKRAWIEYRPKGVVAAIIPWNYPLQNIFAQVSEAVFAGNACIIKVSELASWSAHYFERITKAALKQAALPESLVSFVVGGAEIGEKLLKSGIIDHVTFIGSATVGKAVMQACAENTVPVTLELNGKDPCIIFDDADLESILPTVMRGAFQHQGQNCIGIERILVQDNIHDTLIERIRLRMHKMVQGDPVLSHGVDCGSLRTESAIRKLEKVVEGARNAGAVVLEGGSRNKKMPGYYFQPTLISNVMPNMSIAQNEVFGPVIAVLKFTTEKEAVEIANNTKFGLGSSVFTGDRARARRVASGLETGMINLNDFAASYLCPALPFGGVKCSGFGKFGGVEGLRSKCNIVALTEDIVPFIKTTIPSFLDYPLSDDALPFSRSLVMALYYPGAMERLNNIIKVLKIARDPKPREGDSKVVGDKIIHELETG